MAGDEWSDMQLSVTQEAPVEAASGGTGREPGEVLGGQVVSADALQLTQPEKHTECIADASDANTMCELMACWADPV